MHDSTSSSLLSSPPLSLSASSLMLIAATIIQNVNTDYAKKYHTLNVDDQDQHYVDNHDKHH